MKKEVKHRGTVGSEVTGKGIQNKINSGKDRRQKGLGFLERENQGGCRITTKGWCWKMRPGRDTAAGWSSSLFRDLREVDLPAF